MAGVVFYQAGEACFHEMTAIQPDNPFMVDHRKIRPEHVIGHLPGDFHVKLVAAIKGSVRLTARQRGVLLQMIGET